MRKNLKPLKEVELKSSIEGRVAPKTVEPVIFPTFYKRNKQVQRK
jgi:hypothetical protein